MRPTIFFAIFIAVATAAPAPLPIGEPLQPGTPAMDNLAFDILAEILALLSRITGGRGFRGSHPVIPIPPVTTIKATTLSPSTVPATTLSATTVPATTIGTLTTVAATTLPATTLSATVVPATTIPATTIVIASSSSNSSLTTSAASQPSSSLPSAATTNSSTSPSRTIALDCAVPSTTLPSGASSLPSPTGTFVGAFTGVGTQNYDCRTGNLTSTPSAIGANANLTSTSGTCGTGVHSFDNPSSPRFNMQLLGNTLAAKSATIASPDGAHNVAWIYLTAVDSTGRIVQVYRVNTRGGVAPTMCGTHNGTVKVNYSATYMFYQE